jgi:hypothetical protein
MRARASRPTPAHCSRNRGSRLEGAAGGILDGDAADAVRRPRDRLLDGLVLLAIALSRAASFSLSS